MGERLTIRDAAHRIMTLDGKVVSPETVYFWIRKKGLPSIRDENTHLGTYFIDYDELRRFLGRYSTYKLRESDTYLPSMEEMFHTVYDLQQRMAIAKREQAALVIEEEALKRELYGSISAPAPGNHTSHEVQAKTSKSHGGRTPTRGVVHATLSPEFRAFWVGRGDVGHIFAYFIYVHLAHGIKQSTANGHRRAAHLAAEEKGLCIYPCTILPPGLKGGEDRILVTREQAITNIQVIHNRVLAVIGGDIVPPEFLCLDLHCPCCTRLWGNHQEEQR